VVLSSALPDRSARFSINREDDPDHVLTSVELDHATRPPRTVVLPTTHKESELLHDELEIMGRDRQYENALREVGELLTEP
jgi:hypothetical protein